jgi:hypothetical protein
LPPAGLRYGQCRGADGKAPPAPWRQTPWRSLFRQNVLSLFLLIPEKGTEVKQPSVRQCRSLLKGGRTSRCSVISVPLADLESNRRSRPGCAGCGLPRISPVY